MFKRILKWFNGDKVEVEKFHGFDLTKWDYLGSSDINFHEKDKPDSIVSQAIIHFFVHNKNGQRRWVIAGPKWKVETFTTQHTFIETVAEQWRIGEKELWYPVMDTPSKWLEEYMSKSFEIPYKWDKYSLKWLNDSVKIQNKKTEKNKIKILKEDEGPKANNIVALDFGKKYD